MRNKFGSECYKCGLWVAPGTGHFERHGRSWRVQHGLHPGHGRVTCEEADAALIAAQEANVGRVDEAEAAAGFDRYEHFD